MFQNRAYCKTSSRRLIDNDAMVNVLFSKIEKESSLGTSLAFSYMTSYLGLWISAKCSSVNLNQQRICSFHTVFFSYKKYNHCNGMLAKPGSIKSFLKTVGALQGYSRWE